MKKVLTRMTTSAIAATMAVGGFVLVGSNSSAVMPQTAFQRVVNAAEKSQSLNWNVSGNYKEENGAITCDSIGKGDSFLFSETTGKDFVYEADIQFKERKGAASLIMRSNGKTDDKKEMYVANINGESGAVRLFKFEGNDAPRSVQGTKSQPDR